MAVSCREQEDIEISHGEEHDTASMTEWDDQLSKFPVLFGPATGVWRKRENPHGSLYCLEKPKASESGRPGKDAAKALSVAAG